MTENKFEVNGRSFTIEPLVIGQLMQLEEHLGLKLADIHKEKLNELQNDLPKLLTFFAIVVREDGRELYEKDVQTLAKFFQFNFDTDTMLRFVDFFSKGMSAMSDGLKKKKTK